MLRIAVQSKGRLYEDTMALLAEADIKVSSSKRTLLVQSSNFPVEVLYLRDDDIPQSVAGGVADLVSWVKMNLWKERRMPWWYAVWASASAAFRWPSPRLWIIPAFLGSKARR